ncbi:MAG TPA: hypothetical protein ENK95_01230 [Campylobacterales bacterium]|nr:hypothetical protein [Campylobacterales bacterium]
MTEQEAIEFCKNDPESAAKIILMVERLEARIKELEDKLNMNSSNSSKPPSSDNKLTKKKASQKSSENKRGKPKQEKGKNLLDRLIKYQKETLRFIHDFRVPFTNNLAERDLRMIKVKQKISGTFASFEGAEFFCRIKSFIATLKKNSLSVLDGLRDAFTLQPMRSLGWGC